MHCVLAVESESAVLIKSELQKLKPDWEFEICDHASQLDMFSRKNPDVLVLSRFLEGEKPAELLKHIQVLFPGSHIVLLVGELDEQSKGYIRAARRYELNNYVYGELPGDMPYTLPVSLTRARESDEQILDDQNLQHAEEEIPVEEENLLEKKNLRHDEKVPIPVKQNLKYDTEPEVPERKQDTKSKIPEWEQDIEDEPPEWEPDDDIIENSSQLYTEEARNYPTKKKTGLSRRREGDRSPVIRDPAINRPVAQRHKRNPGTRHRRNEVLKQQKMVSSNQPNYQGGYNRGNIILIVANKGGVGKSTTAITVAMALANAGIEVILVDLNLAGPSIHNFFNFKPDRGIEALAGYNMILLDQVLINAPNQNNLAILPGPVDKTVFPDSMFEQGELAELFDTLSSMAQVVIVDTPSNFWDRPWIPEVFEMADMVLAVVDQSKFSEMDTREHAPKILLMGVNPEKIKIVLNKFSPKLHNARVIEKAFNDKFKDDVPKKMLPRVIATIPADWDKHNLMSYKGRALGLDDPRSQWHRLAEEIANLAGLKYGMPGKHSKKKKGLLGFLKRR